MKRLILALALMIAPAQAETWSTGECQTQNGGRISYMVSKGSGFIRYGNSEPSAMFTYVEDGLAIIKHIGTYGTMIMALDVDTGRGYMITRKDGEGITAQGNVQCKFGRITR